ncbi:MAG: MoaD/ThiS family protein [bacterium]
MVRPRESGKEKESVRVQVRLYSTLSRYAPAEAGPFLLVLPWGATVASAIEALGIPEDTAKVVLVNGRHASLSYSLCEGDILVLFPPVEGG